ncbi:unnamed protein product [Coccothraustes coccothraustes]
MAGDSGMAGKVALLLWAQTLGLAGAQTTQLLVEPPWRPAVLWDQVTLTCQGLGTTGATTWYKDGGQWGQQARDHFTVTLSGTYTCDRPGSGRSPPVTVSNARLELQVSARDLLEGDMVTLRCQRWQNNPVTEVRFYHGDKEVGRSLNGVELSLSPLQLNHSGHYSCKGWVGSDASLWARSAPVTLTVQAPPLGLRLTNPPPLSFPEFFLVPVLEGPPEPTVGSPLTLSCLSTPSPLRSRAPLLHVFYRDRQVVGDPQVSPQLQVPAVGVSHSGNYSCEMRSEVGAVRNTSAQLRVTVQSECRDGHGEPPETPRVFCLVPVANATITPGPLSHQVHAGDNVTLCCSVQVGSAPITFTWLHNGQEVARGPLLELKDIDVGHSGTYQCVATNQMGQDGHHDGHRVFWALSPELVLEVTPGSPWVTGGVTRGQQGVQDPGGDG